MGCVLVAAVAGALYVIISRLVISIKVDDPLDAVAVHAGSGLWGILAAPIFMDTGRFCIMIFTTNAHIAGILYNGSQSAVMMLAWNAAAAASFIVWNTFCGILLFGLLKVFSIERFAHFLKTDYFLCW